jgi:hypothetical protein
MSEQDFFWLVGLLEGEGCFLAPPPSDPKSARIRLKMCDRDVVQRAADLTGGYRIATIVSTNPKWNDAYDFKTTGERAVWLMVALYPYMGARRQAAIARAIAHHPASKNLSSEKSPEKLAVDLAKWSALPSATSKATGQKVPS